MKKSVLKHRNSIGNPTIGLFSLPSFQWFQSMHKLFSKLIAQVFKEEPFISKVNKLNLIEVIKFMQRFVSVCIKNTIKRLLSLKPLSRDFIRHCLVINRFAPYEHSA